jgi:integrase
LSKGLTVKGIESQKPGSARREVPDGLLAGLYLVVQPSGARSWAVRYRAAGVPRKLTLGPYPAIDLGSARELARKALVAVAEGRDPGEEKKAARQAPAQRERDLFEAVAGQFIERYAKANTRESTWRETERLINKNVLPVWKGRAVQSITRRDVIDLLDRVVDRGAAVAANRVLAVVRRLFSWTVERGILELSPSAGVKAPTAERSRDRVLNDDELRRVWRATDVDGWPFGPLVQLLILTGQRRDEVANMRWSELDLEKRLWTLPKERSKNDTAHEVPLSDAVLSVIGRLKKIAGKPGFLFTTTGEAPVSGFSRAKNRLDALVLSGLHGEATGPTPHWTLHDLRRTAASGMARLGINLPVIEKILNHTSGSFAGIVGVYQRHSFADEKRAALETWGRFVEHLVTGESAANVVRLREAL